MAYGMGSSRHTMEPRMEDCDIVQLDPMESVVGNSKSLGGNAATNFLNCSKKMQNMISSSESNTKDYVSEMQDQLEELPI